MTNPFKYGPIALDESFTDRDGEVAELSADALNGQDVVIFAPRRYGKTSLVHRVAQRLDHAPRARGRGEPLVHADQGEVRRTPRPRGRGHPRPRAAGRRRSRAAFAGLRITPTITIDPNDGSLSFSFAAGHTSQDVDDTIEHLLRMLAETSVAGSAPSS